MLYVQDLLLLLSLGAIAYYLRCLHGAYDARRSAIGSRFSPPATVLIPVCDLHEEAYANFSSFCHQDYPHYQIGLGALDPHDPVIPAIEQLIHDFSTHHSQLVVNPHLVHKIQVEISGRGHPCAAATVGAGAGDAGG